MRLLPILLVLLLGACNTPPRESLPLNCDAAKKLCYRGATLDRGATRERFGAAGDVALNQETL